MFRSALVALKPERSASVISFAVELAKNYRLELGGLSIIDVERVSQGEAVPMGASAFKADRDARRLETCRQLAQSVSGELSSACEIAGVQCSSLMSEGDTVGEISRATLGYDLLICGHTPGGDSSDRSLLMSILKHNARPAIVVPRDPVLGSNVLLAYDASFQSARVMASLVHSGILANRQLHVVCLHEEYGVAAARSVSAMNFLRRHGISFECHPEVLVKTPAEQLIETAQRHEVGLIAMGAFGKGAMREFFFGSVTQTMLGKLSIPVLLDH